MEFSKYFIALVLFLLSLLVAWNVYLTIQVIETDRTQEAVFRTQESVLVNNKDLWLRIDALTIRVNNIPPLMLDRYTGSEAKIQIMAANAEITAVRREIDKMHHDLKTHFHRHEDVIHKKSK